MKQIFSLAHDGHEVLPTIVYLYDTSALMRLLRPQEYFACLESNGGASYLDRIGLAVHQKRIRKIPITLNVYEELCQMSNGYWNNPYRRPIFCEVEDDNSEKPSELIILKIPEEEFAKAPYSLIPRRIGPIDLSLAIGANILKERQRRNVKIVTNDGDFDRIKFHFHNAGYDGLAEFVIKRPPEFVAELNL